MTKELRLQREAASELTRRMKRSAEWKERGQVAKISLNRLKTIHSSLVCVHGASQIAEMASHVSFKNYVKWMCEERPTTLDEIDRQQTHGEELLRKLWGLASHQAIANVPEAAKMDPNRWWRAGQYSDQVIVDSTGTGAFDFWFICKGKNSWRELCWTVISAGNWNRKYEDPLATGQVWYCPICGCKYSTSWGTLVEWRIGGTAYICLATYPPLSIENLKAGMAMTGFQAPEWIMPSSPEELLDKIPMATPTSTAMVPVPGYKGCVKFDVETLTTAPLMEWKQHFEMGRQAATGEWKPERGVAQVPAKLPGPDLLPLSMIPEVEQVGGFEVPQMLGGPEKVPTKGTEIAPHDSAMYTGLWSRMDAVLAQSILETGKWDGVPITPIQRQVAYDYMVSQTPVGPRHPQLEEV